MTGDMVDHALVRALHKSGPRPVAELLAEIAALDSGIAEFIRDRLNVYTNIPSSTYRAAGADDWRMVQ